jgi:hypothetical protein
MTLTRSVSEALRSLRAAIRIDCTMLSASVKADALTSVVLMSSAPPLHRRAIRNFLRSNDSGRGGAGSDLQRNKQAVEDFDNETALHQHRRLRLGKPRHAAVIS